MKTGFRSARLACPILLAQFLAPALPAGEDVAELHLAQALGSEFPRTTVGGATTPGGTIAFYLSITYRCPQGHPGMLFAAIADAAQRFALPAGQPSPVTVRIDVPPQQLPWLTGSATTCEAMQRRRADEIGRDGAAQFRLHAAASGYAMLSCRGADGHEKTAEGSTTLDAWLSCPAPPAGSAGR